MSVKLKRAPTNKYSWGPPNGLYLFLIVHSYRAARRLIPFFKQYAIYGAKYEDYKDFSLGIEIISKKGHLTAEGLDQLKEIITRMNYHRKF
jgi:hypothetical protein